MAEATASDFIADYVIDEGVPFLVGIPGHGNLTLYDAFARRADEIEMIMVRHEQAAAHLADGWARVTGKPLVITTSVGPGAVNTLVGLATAMADSIPLVAITGNCQTYFLERGAIQDISHHATSQFTEMARPAVKRAWSLRSANELPRVLPAAFRLATTGRPGPVHIEIPMDVQAEPLSVKLSASSFHPASTRLYPDPAAVDAAATAILAAERPVVLAGGGVILSDAAGELLRLIEWLGIPVITTTQSKGVIPEDHALNAFYTGPKGSSCGSEIARGADLLIAFGFRFSEWASGSYKDGEVFTIPPQRIVQVDIDPLEIGRNYPVEAGVLGDLKATIEALCDEIEQREGRRNWEQSARQQHLAQLQKDWQALVRGQSDGSELTTSFMLQELRRVLPRDSVVVSSSGHIQGQLYQEFPVYAPGAHISAGGFSTMGFTVPAAIGVKLAKPGLPVVGVLGDGDFLMTAQELATAVQYDIPVIYCVGNNAGYLSIRDMQARLFGLDALVATESRFSSSGDWYTPNIAGVARAFGAMAEVVSNREELAPTLERALATERPTVVEVLTAREFPDSGNELPGWAEFPLPRNRDPATG
jgi:acetolactate synthase-1/2/3 large subunit